MSQGNRYDVIIIGSGAGGGTLAYALAPTGKRILIIERGDYVPREKDNWSTRAVNLEGKYHTKEVWRDKGGKPLHPHTNYYVGGNTAYPAVERRLRKNYGPEQERLNQVFGARLRITGLRVASGPGIEFLEYLSPRDGRPMPLDARANDLMHWQTRLVTRDIEQASRDLRNGRFAVVSSGRVSLPKGELRFQKGLLVRDLDGHVMQVVEQ